MMAAAADTAAAICRAFGPRPAGPVVPEPCALHPAPWTLVPLGNWHSR